MTSRNLAMRGAVAAVLLAMITSGCRPTPGTSPDPGLATVQATAAATSDPGAVTYAERRAMEVRATLGLRADLDYVRMVAANPLASSVEYEIPLLPEEIAELLGRVSTIDEVMPIVNAEADAHPDDYCGVYVDNANDGALTSLWRANLPLHEAAIRARISPDANVAFGTCAFSLKQLMAVIDQMGADVDWFESQRAHILGLGPDQAANKIVVEVSSLVTDLDVRLSGRYGVPAQMFRVESDGTGAFYLPWGSVLVAILGPDGDPLDLRDQRDVDIELGARSNVRGLDCELSDVGVGEEAFDCQAGDWTIFVEAEVPGSEGEWVEIGSAPVRVFANEISKVTVRVGPLPSRAPA